MNRTLKEATVRRYHYDSHRQLRQHIVYDPASSRSAYCATHLGTKNPAAARAARLRLAPTPVQNPFGIAVRLRPSLEDEVARGCQAGAVSIRVREKGESRSW
jgi:hypothetical protein